MSNLSTDQVIADMRGWTDVNAFHTAFVAETEQSIQDALNAIPEFYRVFYVSPTGDDSNDGTSLATAFATIRKAVASCPNGGKLEILLEGGNTYSLEGYNGFISVGASAVRFASTGDGIATIMPHVSAVDGKSLARGLLCGFQGAVFFFENVILDTGDLEPTTTEIFDYWGGIVSRGAPGSGSPLEIQFIDVVIRLNDHQMFSSNSVVNIYTVGLTIVQTGNFPTLNSSNTLALSAIFRSITVPNGTTIGDFFDKIARDVDGNPINAISNFNL